MGPSEARRAAQMNLIELSARELWWDSHPAAFGPWRHSLVGLGELEDVIPDSPFQQGRRLRFSGVTTNPSLLLQHLVNQSSGLTGPDPEADGDYVDAVASAGREALPLWTSSRGSHGWVSGQIRPTLYHDGDAMIAQGVAFAALGPNIMVKVPGSQLGYQVVEELVALGVSVNGTLSFTTTQFQSFDSAVRNGLARRRGARQPSRWVFTLMLGRVSDFSKFHHDHEDVRHSSDLRWAEIAVARRISRMIKSSGSPVELLLSSIKDEADESGDNRAVHLRGAPPDAILTLNPRCISALLGLEFDGRGIPDAPRHGAPPRATSETEPTAARVARLLRQEPEIAQAFDQDAISPQEFEALEPYRNALSFVLEADEQIHAMNSRQ